MTHVSLPGRNGQWWATTIRGRAVGGPFSSEAESDQWIADMTCVYCGRLDCPVMNRGQHRRAGEVTS